CPYFLFVYSHAKGIGAHNNSYVISYPSFLFIISFVLLQTCMIIIGGNPLHLYEICYFLGSFTTLTVNYAAARNILQNFNDLIDPRLDFKNAVRQVGPFK